MRGVQHVQSQGSRSGAVVCVCLAAAAAAWAAETLKVTAGFSPDKLGAPTNVHGTATIGSTTGPLPSPIAETTVMGPAGLTVDVKGVGVCNPAKLEADARNRPSARRTPKLASGAAWATTNWAHEDAKSRSRSTSTAAPTKTGTSCCWPTSTRNRRSRCSSCSKRRSSRSPSPTGSASPSRCRRSKRCPGASHGNREEHLHHARRSQRRLLRDGRRQAPSGPRQGDRRPQDTAPTAASPTRR